MHRSVRSYTRALAAAAGVVALASCGSDEPGNSVKDYFSAVQAVVTTGAAPIAPTSAFRPSIGTKTKGDRPLFSAMPPQTISGVAHDGTPPAAADGPGISHAEGSTAFLGQPFAYSLTGTAEFSKVYLWVDGVSGYYELDLPVSVTLVDLVLQVTENAGSSIDLETALSGSGGVGAVHSETLAPRDPADADVFVTLNWSNASDVDLHVIATPTNGTPFEIDYENDTSPDGGHLDLDANPGCSTTNATTPQETISWPHGTAPAGHYQVWVHYYANCGADATTFTGTVFKKGQQVTTFNGSFAGPSSLDSAQPLLKAEFDIP